MAKDKDKKDLHGRTTSASKSLFGKYSRAAESVEEVRVRARLEEEKSRLQRMEEEQFDLLHGKGLGNSPSQQDVENHLIRISESSAINNAPDSPMSKSRASIDAMGGLLGQMSQTRGYGTHKAFMTGINTALNDRSTTKALADLHRSPSTAGGAAKMAANMSTTQIEAVGLQATENLADIDEKIRGYAQNLKPSDDPKKLIYASQERDRALRTKAYADNALGKQRQWGTDLESIHDSSIDFAKKLDKQRQNEQAVADVRSGASGVRAEVSRNFAQAQSTASAAQKAYDEAFKNNATNVAALADAFVAAKEKVETFGAQLDEIKKHGSSRDEKIAKATSVVSVLGTLGTAAGEIYRMHNVTQHENRTRGNTSIMNVGNEMYDDAQAGSMGNVAALMRRNHYATNMAYAANISKNESFARTTVAVGQGVTDLAVGANQLVKGEAAAAANTAANGIVQADRSYMTADYDKANKFLGARADKRDEFAAQDYIASAQMQKYVDFTRSSYHSTAGSGSRRGALTSTLRDTTYLGEMQDLGLDAKATAELTRVGIDSLGGQYNSRNAISAQKAANSGQVSSAAEYMNLAGGISAVGGSDSNLQKTLADAVKLGMDSSKSVNAMTSAMVNMASFSSRGGVSTYGGAQAQVAAGLEAAKNSGIAENQRAQVVADIGQRYQESAQNRNITIPNMMHTAAMMRMGLTPETLAYKTASIMKPDQIRQLKDELAGNEANTQITQAQREANYKDIVSRHGASAIDEALGKKGKRIDGKFLSDLGKESVTRNLNNTTQGWVDDISKQQNMNDVAREMLENPNKKWTSREDKARMDNAKAYFSARTLAKFGAAEDFATTVKTGDINAEVKSGLGKSPSTEKDPGLRMDIETARGALTQLKAGIEEMGKSQFKSMDGFINSMAAAAKQMDGAEFAKNVGSAGAELNTAINNLKETVNLLNQKIGGTADPINFSLRDNAPATDSSGKKAALPATATHTRAGTPVPGMKGRTSP